MQCKHCHRNINMEQEGGVLGQLCWVCFGKRQDPPGIKDKTPPSPNVIVIGDLILDHYVYGDVNRVCPEAPVPVFEVTGVEEYRLGGAGNVAHNLAELGVFTTLFGRDGDNDSPSTFAALGVPSIQRWRTFNQPNYALPIKTRYATENGVLVLRVDNEKCEAPPQFVKNYFIANLDDLIRDATAVVVSDYQKGLLTSDLLEVICKEASAFQRPAIVGAKGVGWEKYKGASIVVANHDEVKAELQHAKCGFVEELVGRIKCEWLVTTKGSKGATFSSTKETHMVATRPRWVFNVTGAGDTFLAALTYRLIELQNAWYNNNYISVEVMRRAVKFANVAAGCVVQKPGTATVTLDDIQQTQN